MELVGQIADLEVNGHGARVAALANACNLHEALSALCQPVAQDMRKAVTRRDLAGVEERPEPQYPQLRRQTLHPRLVRRAMREEDVPERVHRVILTLAAPGPQGPAPPGSSIGGKKAIRRPPPPRRPSPPPDSSLDSFLTRGRTPGCAPLFS